MKKLFLVVAMVLGAITTQAQTKLNIQSDSIIKSFETREQLWVYLNAMPTPDSIIVMIDRDNGINNTQESIEPHIVGGFIALYDNASVYIYECTDDGEFLSWIKIMREDN